MARECEEKKTKAASYIKGRRRRRKYPQRMFAAQLMIVQSLDDGKEMD